MNTPSFSAQELAARFGLELSGNGDTRVSACAPLSRAQAQQLSFLANPRLRAQLAESKAGIVIARASDAEGHPGTVLIAQDPYLSYTKISALFETTPEHAPGIHPATDIAKDASIDPSASIAAFVSIGARSQVKAGARIGPGCVIGEDCIIGEGSELVANVTLVRRVRMGQRVLVHPGAVLGADGFGLAPERAAGAELRWHKVPQLGGVEIGDDCEIGANTTIDRGALDDTVLGCDVHLDNLIQVAHNVRIGDHTVMAGCVGIAGSAVIGRHCMVGGKVGIAGHLTICDNVTITAMSMVIQSIDTPGEYASGVPVMMDSRSWRKNLARLRQLDTLARRVGALEKATS